MGAIATRDRGLTVRLPRRVFPLLSDDRLVHELRAGNEAAFEAVCRRHRERVTAFCRHLVGTRAGGEDAARQTFAAARTSLLRSDAPVRLRPWLLAMAYGCCRLMLADGAAAQPDGEVAGELQRLPVDERAALILCELLEFDHRAIAEALGCPRWKVQAIVSQARAHLLGYRTAPETPCREIRRGIAAGRHSDSSRWVRRHVADCAQCARFRADVRSQRSALAASLAGSDAAAARPAGPSRPQRLSRPERVRLAAVAAAAVAVLAVAAASLLGGTHSASADRTREAAAPHGRALFPLIGRAGTSAAPKASMHHRARHHSDANAHRAASHHGAGPRRRATPAAPQHRAPAPTPVPHRATQPRHHTNSHGHRATPVHAPAPAPSAPHPAPAPAPTGNGIGNGTGTHGHDDGGGGGDHQGQHQTDSTQPSHHGHD